MTFLIGFSSLFLVSILYAINDVFIKMIGTQLTVYQQILFRTIVGLVFISVAIFLTKPAWNLHKISKINLILYTLSFPITILLFTLGITHGKIASVVFSFYAGSILFSFSSGILFFHEKATRGKIMSLVLTLIGLLFFTYPFSLQDLNIGFFYGLLAGAVMVFTNSINKHVAGKIHYEILTFLQMLGGILLASSLIFLLRQSFIPHITIPMLGLTILSGFFLLSVVFLAAVGFRHFDLNFGTIVCSLELFFAPLFAFVLLGEGVTLLEIIGGIFLGFAISIPHAHKISKRTKKLTKQFFPLSL